MYYKEEISKMLTDMDLLAAMLFLPGYGALCTWPQQYLLICQFHILCQKLKCEGRKPLE
jgi:hypothetical protein